MAASHANGADRRRRLGIFAKTFERPSVDDVFAAVAGHGLATVQFNMASAGLETVPESWTQLLAISPKPERIDYVVSNRPVELRRGLCSTRHHHYANELQ